MAIAGVIFSALAVALVGGVRTALVSQQEQQAGDLLNQAVERSRSLGYDALTMRDGDLNAMEVDPASGTGTRTPTLTGCLCYDFRTNRTDGSAEQLAHDPAGGLSPHVSQPAQNGLTYTLRQYVTLPADGYGATYKRLTAVITWVSGGRRHTRTYSTLVAPAKRGLPLPDFTLTGDGPLTQCRNPGSEAVYAFTLKNNGARDAWQIAASPAAGWSYYTDSNASGSYDSSDSPLATSPAAVPSTGLVETKRSTSFYAVRPIAALLPLPPYTVPMTLRATSTAVPDVYKELVTSTVVQAGACGTAPTTPSSPSSSPTGASTAAPTPPPQPAAPCTPALSTASASAPGGTAVRYYLANPGQPGNTDAAVGMPVNKDAGALPGQAELYAYSQDLSASAGRYLDDTAAGTPRSIASWSYQMPATSTLKGTGALTLYAAPASGTAAPAPAFSVRLDVVTTTSSTTIATATAAPPAWGCAGYRAFGVELALPNSGTTVAANATLRLTVTTANAVPVRLGYGTSTFPSALVLPYKTGVG